MTTLPNTGATELALSQAVPETTVNEALRRLDANATRSIIEDRDLATPPGTCADGARYLVAASPTGLWSSKAGQLAIAVGANAANGWLFQVVAVEGYELYVRDEDSKIVFNGSAWVVAANTPYTDENARDAIGAALTAGSGINVTVNDGADTITVAWAGGAVLAPSPTNGQVLTYDSSGGGKWVAAAAPGSGGGSGGTVPAGGTTGQVLMKNSGVDQDVSWKSVHAYDVGPSAPYPTIAAAVAAINAGTAPSVNNRAVIRVAPGKYTMTSAVTVPAWTGIVGISKGLVQFQNDTTTMFVCSGYNWFENFLIEGSPTAALYAFDCNNTTANHIRNVDMLNNSGTARQKFLTQVGSTWTVLFIEHCIVDYRGTSDYHTLIQNTSGAARLLDVNINDCFFDSYGLTGYGGSILLRAVRDVRVKRSTIRGAATWNTGVRLEKSGATGTPTCEIKHCDFANLENSAGGVSIYNEAGTTVYLTNSDAPASAFAGTVVNRNSYVV